jgi:hypothetical protein
VSVVVSVVVSVECLSSVCRASVVVLGESTRATELRCPQDPLNIPRGALPPDHRHPRGLRPLDHLHFVELRPLKPLHIGGCAQILTSLSLAT